jgi:DNA-binding NtrC family response regulator
VLRPEAFQGILEAVPARAVLPTLGVLEAARAAAKQAGSPPVAPTDAYNLDELERAAIQRALAAPGGNRTRAAKLLGISERTLRNKLKIRPEEAAAADN